MQHILTLHNNCKNMLGVIFRNEFRFILFLTSGLNNLTAHLSLIFSNDVGWWGMWACVCVWKRERERERVIKKMESFYLKENLDSNIVFLNLNKKFRRKKISKHLSTFSCPTTVLKSFSYKTTCIVKLNALALKCI